MTLPILVVSLSDQFQMATHHHTHCTCDLDVTPPKPLRSKMMGFLHSSGPAQRAWMEKALEALTERPDLICTIPIPGVSKNITFDYHGARRIKPFQHVTSIF